MRKRRDTAENVCLALFLAIDMGFLDAVPLELRKMIGDPLEDWVAQAEETKLL